jgi:hypothetical protein
MSHGRSRLPPIVPALLLQLLAAAIIVFALRVSGIGAPPWLAALASGALAALCSRFVGQERWWAYIHLLLAPAAVLLFTLQLNPWIYLFVFIALLLVYWSTFRTRVPLYLSGPRVWQAVQALLPPAHPDRTLRVIDLGSGLGGLLLCLGAARSDAQFHGVELAPLPMLISRLRIAQRGLRNCSIRWGSFWPLDLHDYDVVFAFLSPVPMSELWRKASTEMHRGSLFISSSFDVPGQEAPRIVTVDDARGTRLHVWTM